MKVTTIEDTRERLKLSLRPIYVPVYVIFGLLGVAGGIWTLKVLAVSISISLAGGTLVYSNAFLGHFETIRNSASVDEIREIVVEIPEGTNTVEVVVHTGTGSWAMPLVSEGGEGKERIAGELSREIAAREGNYRFEDNKVLPGAALGLAVLAAGAIGLAFLQTSTVQFDRVSGEWTVRRRLWLLPFVSSKRSVALEDFRKVELRSFSMPGRGAPVTSYNVVIVTRSSEDIPVAYGPMFRQPAAQELKRLLQASKAKKKR